jgi:anhydro-N-acetylmuramic acid kinase
VLNLGGIANLTVISEDGQAVMAFDTGPANVLIDEAMRKLYGQDFDQVVRWHFQALSTRFV